MLEESDDFVLEYINNAIISRIVRFDLVRYFDIKREDVLLGLLKSVGGASGNLVEFQSLAKNFGANRETITLYFSYLIKSFLVDLVYNYTPSVVKQLRTSKKAFIAHPNLIFALLRLTPDNPLLQTKMGSLAETYVYNLLRTKFKQIHFWREKEKEVDFIVTDAEKIIPVEVKFKNQIDRKDLNSLIYFCNRYELQEAIVITKNTLQENDLLRIKLRMIPAMLL